MVVNFADRRARVVLSEHIRRARRVLPAVILIGGLCAPVTARQATGVVLSGQVEVAPPPGRSSMMFFKYDNLARIDPKGSFDDVNGQTLSIFGREDLIAGSSDDFKARRCRPLQATTGALEAIVAGARKTSMVIVNESHERSEHRGFIAEIAKRLRPLGYDTMAMETLVNNAPGVADKFRPTFLKEPSLRYFVDDDGYYLSEAGFGRLGRQAKALGYRLLPYEANEDHDAAARMTREQQIAAREESQTRNLAAFIRANPRAKLLIHVGYSHATEVARPDGARWMATRLKAKTGIDPLTISQTTCRGSGAGTRLSALPREEPTGTFDLVVDHAAARFVRGRPQWRVLAGDRLVDIPATLRPTLRWRVVEARPVGEPSASVPIDRVAIRPGEDVALLLPPGRYALRVIDVAPSDGKSK